MPKVKLWNLAFFASKLVITTNNKVVVPGNVAPLICYSNVLVVSCIFGLSYQIPLDAFWL